MERQASSKAINNDFYEELADQWYTASDHPIALLRAENAVRIPWILGEIGENKTVLDIGCGAGILTNALAEKGHTVSGIDLSESSLKVAEARDATKKVDYRAANAYSLPYPNQTFDVVCAMDVLEHVEEPALLISEASRVLKPGGLFFFHTFNRNFLSYLLIIKGVEWCVPNAPKNMHVYPLFIKPEELTEFCIDQDLRVKKMHGFRPQIFSRAFFKMLFTRKVPHNFGFCFSKSLATGYCGYAKKGELYGSSHFKREAGQNSR
jgi:2-polyprenyl-6-hydroxyphenyl methylase/3-demethylubiquinone-9 3-methyltransferase